MNDDEIEVIFASNNAELRRNVVGIKVMNRGKDVLVGLPNLRAMINYFSKGAVPAPEQYSSTPKYNEIIIVSNDLGLMPQRFRDVKAIRFLDDDHNVQEINLLLLQAIKKAGWNDPIRRDGCKSIFSHTIKLSRYLCPTCKRILIEGELEGTQFIRCQHCGDISEVYDIPGSWPLLIKRWEDDVEYVR